MAYLSEEQLRQVGLRSVGRNVRLSDKASLHNPSAIELGDDCRIDDFVVMSAGAGGIGIGRNVHIACFCFIVGAATVTLEDFSAISARVSIFSSSDDFSGRVMANPTVPARFTGVRSGPVTLGRHVLIGAGTVVLPGVRIAQGTAVGALSLVKDNCEEFKIYVGVPARVVGERSRRLLKLEREFLGE